MRAPAPWARATLTAIALAVMVGPVAPASATASPPGILVSLDGVQWMPGPVAGPLPPLGPLVPGGAGQWVIYLRNASPVSALLHVSASVQASASYSAALTLTAEAGAVHGPARSSVASDCIELLSGIELASGEETTVTIVATVAATAGDEVQGQTATAMVYATLVELPGATTGPSCPLSPSQPARPPSAMARTGSDGPATRPVAFGALAAVLLGCMVVAARRRSGPDRKPETPTGRRR